ncbi:hypothetical protein A0H81_08704 [Grifola frondosa]|uniref:Uncharacterized protein n=1 Tax=Grifola frondosa TaxID=5627 RepID=A0A1C7M2P3_GRIFR|nr:hypothetical protein A0H81_08704 [Grifola frondosa]
METCPPEIHDSSSPLPVHDGTTGRSLSLSRATSAGLRPYQWQMPLDIWRKARLAASAHKSLRATPHILTSPHLPPLPVHPERHGRRRRLATLPIRGMGTFQQAILRFAAPTLCTLTFVCLDPPLTAPPTSSMSSMCPPAAHGAHHPRPLHALGMWLQKSSPDCPSPRTRAPSRRACARTCGACTSRARPRPRVWHEGRARPHPDALPVPHAPAPVDPRHVGKQAHRGGHPRRVRRARHRRASLNLAPLPRLNDLPRSRQAKEVTWDRILPDTLELFVIQPPPTALTDFFCSCCMELRGDVDVMRTFEAMARDADERFLYLPTRRRMGYGYEEAKADWLDRIHDGPGCWTERKVHQGTIMSSAYRSV